MSVTMLFLVLGLMCVFVSSAPVEQVDGIIQIAKRDQEQIFFGNQQNDPRLKKKKSDPSVPLMDQDLTVDQGGFVKALPATPEVIPSDSLENNLELLAQDSELKSAQVEHPGIVQADSNVHESRTDDTVEEELEEIVEQSNMPSDEDLLNIGQPEMQSVDVPEVQSVDVPEVHSAKAPEVPSVLAPGVQSVGAPEMQSVEVPELPEMQRLEAPEVQSAEDEISEAQFAEEVPNADETELQNSDVSNVGDPQTMTAEPELQDNQDLMDLYYYMLENGKNQKGNNYNNGQYDYYQYRKRRSSHQASAVTEGSMVRNEPVIKRSKRIKRDLFDDEDAYYYPYENVDVYAPALTDEDLYELYRPEPKDEIDEILDLYRQQQQQRRPELDESVYEPYSIQNRYEPESIQQLYEPESIQQLYEPDSIQQLYEPDSMQGSYGPYSIQESYKQYEEPDLRYVPSKRQMLSSLPGIRKRYFYPSNAEPATHWGAFVPGAKRDYDSAYRRLMALATALSEQSPNYYEVYKKK